MCCCISPRRLGKSSSPDAREASSAGAPPCAGWPLASARLLECASLASLWPQSPVCEREGLRRNGEAR